MAHHASTQFPPRWEGASPGLPKGEATPSTAAQASGHLLVCSLTAPLHGAPGGAWPAERRYPLRRSLRQALSNLTLHTGPSENQTVGCRAREVRGPSTSVSPGPQSPLQPNPASVSCPEYITNHIDRRAANQSRRSRSQQPSYFICSPDAPPWLPPPRSRRRSKKTTECQVPQGWKGLKSSVSRKCSKKSTVLPRTR